MAINIEPASVESLSDIRQLLGACGLPHADLTDSHMPDFFVALDRDRKLLGCIGLERHGDAGLLRSLAVVSTARGTGVGHQLFNHLHKQAVADGVSRLYLLTTTAAQFFAARGYVITERTAAPTAVQRTTEFSSLCPASAECMSISISTP